MAKTHKDDESLLAGIVVREAESMAALYDRYAASIFGLCLKILKNHHTAEDAMQETFISVWQRAASYAPTRGSVRGWLMILCRNQCIDMQRSHLREQRKTTAFEHSAEATTGRMENDGLHNVHLQILHKSIVAALNKLSGSQRLLIERAYFEGMTQSELAAAHDLPLGTVKTRMRLGLQKLRLALASELELHKRPAS